MLLLFLLCTTVIITHHMSVVMDMITHTTLGLPNMFLMVADYFTFKGEHNPPYFTHYLILILWWKTKMTFYVSVLMHSTTFISLGWLHMFLMWKIILVSKENKIHITHIALHYIIVYILIQWYKKWYSMYQYS